MVSLTPEEARRLRAYASQRGMSLGTALRVIALEVEVQAPAR